MRSIQKLKRTKTFEITHPNPNNGCDILLYMLIHNVTLDGISLQSSLSWGMHYLQNLSLKVQITFEIMHPNPIVFHE